MASEPLTAFLLLGLGYRVLSTSSPRLPLVRWLVRQFDLAAAARTAEAALAARTNRDVRGLLEDAIAQHVDLRLLEGGRLPRSSSPASL